MAAITETDANTVDLVAVVAKCASGVLDGNAFDAQLACFVAGQYLGISSGACGLGFLLFALF